MGIIGLITTIYRYDEYEAKGDFKLDDSVTLFHTGALLQAPMTEKFLFNLVMILIGGRNMLMICCDYSSAVLINRGLHVWWD